MVIGIGIDIIEIDRIKQSVDEYGDQYLKKVYTPGELKYCLAKKNKYQHLAARFAAKEAIYKAISSNWDSELSWQDMEIINASNGMPEVKFKGNLEKFLSNDKSLKISMSHSRDYVACVAIVYKSN
ncbi:MAG TPA: holo-ACP synthase [Ignavibacteriaceae bacterium]|nr:holo-ACP synthase [Ignavibacteriaceae bacterium]